MTVDTSLESLYQQVELVRGAGDRRLGQLCVMSFVAFLAGEGHSDKPATASILIRRFAMTINDEMPDHLRQRLKPFAPRIFGTCDGKDPARARFLIEVARSELLPHIAAEFDDAAPDGVCTSQMSPWRRKAETIPELRERVVRIVSYTCDPGHVQTCEEVALAIVRLICQCGRTAGTPA